MHVSIAVRRCLGNRSPARTGELRHQPVDGPQHPGRRRPRQRAVVDARPDLPAPGPHRRADRADPRPARHGLRRQRRDRDRRQRARFSVPVPRADRGRSGVPELVRPQRLRHPGSQEHQRGRRRPAADRALPARRHRVPHRPRRALPGPGAVRPPGHHAPARRPPLLPPRHGADRARRAGGRGPVRTAQGRWRPQVLHPGGTRLMTAIVGELRTADAVAEAEHWTARNYHPLPVVIADAEGAWVTDVDGRRYLDCLAGYSALNFGHRHPALVGAARDQLDRLTLTSRAFLHDQFGPFCRELAQLCETDLTLPMDTGAEAVETAIKVSRAWGYRVKGVPQGQATIVVAADNFHGRTTTIISFSTDPDARNDFGPYTPGFRIVPYGDLEAMAEAIDDTTVAVL